MKDFNKDTKLDGVTFFLLEKTVKTIKRYSARLFKEQNVNLTIDQWLLLKKIQDEESINQLQLANFLFKDTASITRTLDLLEKKGLVVRTAAPDDRRRYILSLTKEGKKVYEGALESVLEQRKTALDGLSADEIQDLQLMLNKIMKNIG